MKKNLFRILFLLTGLLLLESCVPSKPAFDTENVPSDRLIKKLEANRRKIKTFKASGVINVMSPEMEAKANFEVVLQKPDTLKFDVYGPFGIDLAHALITGKNFVFHDVLRNKVHKGRNSATVINRIFNVDLSFNELMDAFAGSVNLTDKLRSIPTGYDTYEDNYILTYEDIQNDKKSVYQVESENLAITEYLLTTMGGESIIASQYRKFKTFDEVPVPYYTIIKNEEKSQEVTIEYRNIEVNGKTGELKLNYPTDAEVIEWDM